MEKIIFILIVSFIFSGAASTSFAARTKSKKKKQSPITINANRMQYLKDENCMVAEDNVVVKFDGGTLMADKIIAFQGTTPEGKQDFTRIVATGNVIIKTPDRTLYGQKAVWQKNKKNIRVTGNPVVKEKGGQVIQADVIKYDLLLKKVTFEGTAKAKMSVSGKKDFDFTGF